MHAEIRREDAAAAAAFRTITRGRTGAIGERAIEGRKEKKANAALCGKSRPKSLAGAGEDRTDGLTDERKRRKSEP